MRVAVNGQKKGVSIARPIVNGITRVVFLFKFLESWYGGNEHDREAVQSAWQDRVVCCVGYRSGRHVRRRSGAGRRCKTPGCRGAGDGQEARKEGRQKTRKKGREEGPAAEIRPQSGIHYR